MVTDNPNTDHRTNNPEGNEYYHYSFTADGIDSVIHSFKAKEKCCCKNNNAKPPSPPQTLREDSKANRWSARANVAIALLAFVAFFTTLYAVWVAKDVFVQTQRQANIADSALKESKRMNDSTIANMSRTLELTREQIQVNKTEARASVKVVDIKPLNRTGDKFDVTVKIENTGKTDASNVYPMYRFEVNTPYQWGLRVDSANKVNLCKKKYKGTILPAGQHGWNSLSMTNKSNDAAFTNGGVGLYLWGNIAYDDAFGNSYFFKFSYKFDFAQGKFVALSEYTGNIQCKKKSP